MQDCRFRHRFMMRGEFSCYDVHVREEAVMYTQLSQLSGEDMSGDIAPAWLMQFADEGIRNEYMAMNPGMDAVTA